MTRIGLLAALAGLSIASAAEAQQYAHVIADGRTVTIPADATTACAAPQAQNDDRYAYVVTFDCRDAISGMEGSGFFGVGRTMGETTPREYLHQIAQTYWPTETVAQWDARILGARVEFSGTEQEFLCLSGVDETAPRAEATCVLAQPGTQVIVHGTSSTLDQAYGVIAMFLTFATIT